MLQQTARFSNASVVELTRRMVKWYAAPSDIGEHHGQSRLQPGDGGNCLCSQEYRAGIVQYSR